MRFKYALILGFLILLSGCLPERTSKRLDRIFGNFGEPQITFVPVAGMIHDSTLAPGAPFSFGSSDQTKFQYGYIYARDSVIEELIEEDSPASEDTLVSITAQVIRKQLVNQYDSTQIIDDARLNIPNGKLHVLSFNFYNYDFQNDDWIGDFFFVTVFEGEELMCIMYNVCMVEDKEEYKTLFMRSMNTLREI